MNMLGSVLPLTFFMWQREPLLERENKSEGSTATIVTADYCQDVHNVSLSSRLQHSTPPANKLPRSPVLPSNPQGGSFHFSSPKVGTSLIGRH